LEEAGDRVSTAVLCRKPERREIWQLEGAVSANISAAFFGSLKEKAVYSSMSFLAFFMDILLFLTIS